MKKIIDPKLPIRIENKFVSYDLIKDSLVFTTRQVTHNRKNGYLFYDEKERNLGIVYMSDDKRNNRYGNAEILFYKNFKKEFGTWRIILINGQYLPFERLEKLLSENGQYRCTTDARKRNP